MIKGRDATVMRFELDNLLGLFCSEQIDKEEFERKQDEIINKFEELTKTQ